MNSLHNLVAEAIDIFATAVAAKIAAPTKDYSTGKLPDGVNKRTFAKRCTAIAEARKEGHLWRCPVSAWHASFPQAIAGEDPYAAAVRKAGAK
jgi:hypothetical protein